MTTHVESSRSLDSRHFDKPIGRLHAAGTGDVLTFADLYASTPGLAVVIRLFRLGPWIN